MAILTSILILISGMELMRFLCNFLFKCGLNRLPSGICVFLMFIMNFFIVKIMIKIIFLILRID